MLVFNFSLFSFSLVSILICNKKEQSVRGDGTAVGSKQICVSLQGFYLVSFFFVSGARTSTDFKEPGNFDLFMRNTYKIQKFPWKSSFYGIGLC